MSFLLFAFVGFLINNFVISLKKNELCQLIEPQTYTLNFRWIKRDVDAAI